MLTDYLFILIFIVFAGILGVVMLTLSRVLTKPKPNQEKNSPYECGFPAFESAHIPADVRFYLVAILFIIFDLEAVFFFPWAISLSHLTSWGYWTMIDFIIELGLGFLYAWRIGALEWE